MEKNEGAFENVKSDSNSEEDNKRKKQTENLLPRFSYNEFQEYLMKKEAQPIVEIIDKITNIFKKRKIIKLTEHQKYVHNVLMWMHDKISGLEILKDEPKNRIDEVLEGIERSVMIILHENLFQTLLDILKLKEKKTINQIRIHGWIQLGHLDFVKSVEYSLIREAMNHLNKINKYISPRDKITCIINCCRLLSESLNSQECNADDLTSLLVYVILKAKTRNLFMNVYYIQTYRSPALIHGISMYSLTALLSALTFIENLDGTHLSIDKEEYSKYVKYASKLNTSHDSSSSSDENSNLSEKSPSVYAINLFHRVTSAIKGLSSDIFQFQDTDADPLEKDYTGENHAYEYPHRNEDLSSEIYDMDLACALSLSELTLKEENERRKTKPNLIDNPHQTVPKSNKFPCYISNNDGIFTDNSNLSYDNTTQTTQFFEHSLSELNISENMKHYIDPIENSSEIQTQISPTPTTHLNSTLNKTDSSPNQNNSDDNKDGKSLISDTDQKCTTPDIFF